MAKFQPGQSGNPAGRPKGSRNKLTETFLGALSKDFEEHGAAAIKTVRETDPSSYLKVIAQIILKQLELTNPLGDLSEEKLDALEHHLAGLRAAAEGAGGAGEAEAGAGE